ncbi:glycosyltransferase family 10 domain-containing protein [Butyrivibrio proteoclasticus]|uniref:glycosyltransferase family 10 domain-containing protein n=1 Tax=Butyrivibrio proteoclasticus TaxID=43305 RepID=UPI000687D842|nr:glycosyltransferase family 10 [Butyrivibrio proteoclasticus]
MKTIKIKYVDWWLGFDHEDYIFDRVLRKNFDVVLSDNPDFVLGSVYSKDALSYDCVRILYSGEDICPDFNMYDYAIGFETLDFGDRYLYAPNYIMNPKYSDDVRLMLQKHKLTRDEVRKDDFCSFVVSNGNADPIRNDFYEALSEYKKINSGGRFKNNIGVPEGVTDKYAFQRKHKFSICFENSSHPGYITEKLVQGFAAGTVPIYWGASDVAEYFNKNAMIIVDGKNGIDDAIKKVIEVDNDDELYFDMLEQPALVNEDFISRTEKNIENFILNIFEQDVSQARRRANSQTICTYYGITYEKPRTWIERMLGLKKE